MKKPGSLHPACIPAKNRQIYPFFQSQYRPRKITMP
jgi:hypothetical protein